MNTHSYLTTAINKDILIFQCQSELIHMDANLWQSILLIFYYSNSRVSGPTFRSLIHIEFSLYTVKGNILIYCFPYNCLEFSAPRIQQTIYSTLYILAFFICRLTEYRYRDLFLEKHSPVWWIYLPLFLPTPCCFCFTVALQYILKLRGWYHQFCSTFSGLTICSIL